MRDSGLADREAPAQSLAADLGLLGDVLKDFKATRIGQGFGDPLELLGLHGRFMLRKPYDL